MNNMEGASKSNGKDRKVLVEHKIMLNNGNM